MNSASKIRIADNQHVQRGIMRSCSRMALVASVAVGSGTALATEGGGNSYPVGVETNYVGMMLPEGAHGFLYLQHYSASKNKNNNGDNNPQLADFDLKADIFAARLSYVWPGARLFGATIETRLVQPFASVDATVAVARPAPLIPLDRGGNATGVGDLSFSPIILGWHSPTYHHTVGLDTFLRTGSYDVNARVNTGRNYYQVAPFYAFTWLPTKNVDISAKIRMAFNSENHATNYRSGDELSLEFGGGYHFTQAFAAGLNGYIYRQTTDDKQLGARVNGNGNRGSVDALGPYFSYAFTREFQLIGKVQQEFNARNRPEGTRVWLQVKLPF